MKDMDLITNVVEIANGLLTAPGCKNLTPYEALSIAVQIQRNELYCQAHVVNTIPGTPSALEKIAMELHGITAQIPYIGQ